VRKSGFPIFFDLFSAKLDRVDQTPAGPVIVELKSSRVRRSAEEQLRMFSLAYFRVKGELPLKAIVKKPPTQKQPEISCEYVPTEEDLLRLEEEIWEVVARMESQRFEAIPSSGCTFGCAYAKMCPNFIATPTFPTVTSK